MHVVLYQICLASLIINSSAKFVMSNQTKLAIENPMEEFFHSSLFGDPTITGIIFFFKLFIAKFNSLIQLGDFAYSSEIKAITTSHCFIAKAIE